MVSHWYGDKKTKTPPLNAFQKRQNIGTFLVLALDTPPLIQTPFIYSCLPAKFHHDRCWSSHVVLPSMLGTFDPLESKGGQASAMHTTRNWMCKNDLSVTPQSIFKVVRTHDWLEVGKYISRRQYNFVFGYEISECKAEPWSKASVFTSTSDDSHHTPTN